MSVYLVDRGDLVERERLLTFAWLRWRYPPPSQNATHTPTAHSINGVYKSVVQVLQELVNVCRENIADPRHIRADPRA